MTEIPDLWPSDGETFVGRSGTMPVEVLMEQAKLLGAKTRGLLEGVVTTSHFDANDEGHPDAGQDIRFHHVLWARAPHLGDYRHALLSLTHDMAPFPVVVQLAGVAESTGADGLWRANNQEELLEALRAALSHEATRSVVSYLVAQSRAHSAARAGRTGGLYSGAQGA